MAQARMFFVEQQVSLNPDDTLLLYTVGTIEARAGEVGLYGEERLRRRAEELRGEPRTAFAEASSRTWRHSLTAICTTTSLWSPRR